MGSPHDRDPRVHAFAPKGTAAYHAGESLEDEFGMTLLSLGRSGVTGTVCLRAVLLVCVMVVTACGGDDKQDDTKAARNPTDPRRVPTATVPAQLPTPIAALDAGETRRVTLPDTYVVKPGDTVATIARELGVAADDLTRANPNLDPRSLRIGQELRVPRQSPTPAAHATPPGPAAPTGTAVGTGTPARTPPGTATAAGGTPTRSPTPTGRRQPAQPRRPRVRRRRRQRPAPRPARTPSNRVIRPARSRASWELPSRRWRRRTAHPWTA